MEYKKSCARCGHKWIARKEKEPVVCPECHSPYWTTSRVPKRKVKGK